MNSNLNELEKVIKYKFKTRRNLITALSHSSYVNEKRKDKYESNERLEFLGDSILNFVISEKIYKTCSEFSEGDMTRVRANIVCESSLLICAVKLNLGKYLLLGRGEEITGGRTRVSILSDAFEALIGSIYIDGGITPVRKFILDNMENLIKEYLKGTVKLDYKTELQEIVQRNGDAKIYYEVIEEKGPDHDKVFVSQVNIQDIISGVGEGRSKKEAEQNAARKALGKYTKGDE